MNSILAAQSPCLSSKLSVIRKMPCTVAQRNTVTAFSGKSHPGCRVPIGTGCGCRHGQRQAESCRWHQQVDKSHQRVVTDDYRSPKADRISTDTAMFQRYCQICPSPAIHPEYFPGGRCVCKAKPSACCSVKSR